MIIILTTLFNKSFSMKVVQTVIKNKIADFNKIKQALVKKKKKKRSALFIHVSLGWVELVID